MRRAILSSLASASALALAVAAGPALAEYEPGTGSHGNSEADIALSDCTVESSKDISYIAFLSDGEELDKDESIEGETFDLTSYDDIDEVDQVRVKSGTTVETFDNECTTT